MHIFIRYSFLLISSMILAQNTATYSFTFTSSWNEIDHTSIPNNAHWSDLVGAIHKTKDYFLKTGEVASLGVKNVAELGNNNAFNNEVNTAITSNESIIWLESPFSPFSAISSASLNDIQVTAEHHLITLISMIAPSPDWFVAINSLDLRNETNTNWKTDFTIDIFAYDSGTDDGINYNSPNAITSPSLDISLITGAPFNGKKLGTLSVILNSTLGFNEASIYEDVNIFFNTNTDKLTISNIKNIDLRSIEIYSVMGKLIKNYTHFTHNQQNLEYNLSGFNKGIYVVKLLSYKGQTLTKKLGVN